MPHVIIKMYPGRGEDIKKDLVQQIAKVIQDKTGCDDNSISVSIEEIAAGEWPEKVYRPDIMEKANLLYKKPGYNPFE
ncbi:MAG TPA: tautomerase family protein [Spirochaetota bacterium]|nr:tautomerase family protein [Spirochaetota bacterium]